MHVELLMLISPLCLQPSWHSWRISQPWPWRIKQYPGMPASFFGFPTLLPVCHGSPAGAKVHIQHLCTTGVSPWHLPASPMLYFSLFPVSRVIFPFFASCHTSVKSLLWIQKCRGQGSPSGSPNPGGWRQSCLESRACRAQQWCVHLKQPSVSPGFHSVWVGK